MKKIAIFLIACVAFTQCADPDPTALAIGDYIKDLNLGSCLAFQDDTTDTTTTCYKSCAKTSTEVYQAFNTSTYSSLANPSDFMNKISVIGIKFMGQFSDCKTTEFLMALDNRLSNLSFLVGTGSNLAVQAGMAAAKYFGFFNGNSALYSFAMNIYNAITDSNQRSGVEVGKMVTLFLANLVNYKAPNIAVQLETQ